MRGSATTPYREAKRFVSYDKRQAALAKASVFATLLRKAVHRSDTRQSGSAPTDVRLRVLYVGVCGIDVIESVGKESHGA